MASIQDILDPIKVKQLFNQRKAEIDPAITEIVVEKVKVIKSNFHHEYYSLVIAYDLIAKQGGADIKLSIYCSAHSSESRRQTWDNLRLLWDKQIANKQFLTNRPLFYDPDCRGLFYTGLPGHNLDQYFKAGQLDQLNDYLQSIAGWLARLHKLTKGLRDWPDSRQQLIGQVVPGRQRALNKIRQNCPQEYSRFVQLYDILERREAKHWPSRNNLTMIHGDLHPENIIVNQKRAAIIDWADASLGDPARDLGAFVQQLAFMGQRHLPDIAYWQQAQKFFLEAYQTIVGEVMAADWSERLETYYNFAAFRTAVYFVTKSGPEPQRASGLLTEVEFNLI